MDPVYLQCNIILHRDTVPSRTIECQDLDYYTEGNVLLSALEMLKKTITTSSLEGAKYSKIVQGLECFKQQEY